MKVGNDYGWRSTSARRAVDVYQAALFQQLIQDSNALGKLFPKISRIEISNGDSSELYTRGPVVVLKRTPIKIQGPHIFIRLQIKHRSDAGSLP